MADDGLKAEVAEWAATQAVMATEEELIAYARAAAAEGQELTDEQPEKVAGGGYGSVVVSIASIGLLCDF